MVAFGIDRNRNLIIQFPIFMQLYTQQPLNIIPVGNSSSSPVPIVDKNTKAKFIHSTSDQEILLSFKYGNVYKC